MLRKLNKNVRCKTLFYKFFKVLVSIKKPRKKIGAVYKIKIIFYL